jgi:mannose-1-phosphate guanylyltransferase
LALHAIILAGGSGTRFWPLSRMKRPKQFLKLVTGRPLLSETFHRVEALCPSSRTWVVCGEDHQEGVRDALPDLPPAHLLVEPAARNTAPAIGLAAVHARAEDPDAMLVVLPSDHHVANPEAFRAALELAAQAAERGDLLAIGIRPTRAETGYGYLRRGDPRAFGAYAVDAFVEKPDALTAQRYLQDSAYCWNAGIFVFRADAILAALSRHMPKVFEGLEQIARALPGGGGPAAAREAFPRMPSISIDYGVMEPEANTTRRIALVPGDFGWSDVGSFAALPEVRTLDGRGNALSGDTLAVDCDDCVVLSEGDRLVAAVGLRGLCIVDAGDALLVVPRDRAQDVRAAVEALRKLGRLDKL